MLSSAAAKRLVLYCRRSKTEPPEYVERGRRRVPYVGQRLREVVWADVEVHEILLAADDPEVWERLLKQIGERYRWSLLDLCCAMTLQAERHTAA
jgi:hypothetical protein